MYNLFFPFKQPGPTHTSSELWQMGIGESQVHSHSPSLLGSHHDGPQIV